MQVKPKYHLLADVPTVLRVNADGQLYCSDGQDVRKYLKERFAGLPFDTPIALVESETLKRLNDMAWLVPYLMLAA